MKTLTKDSIILGHKISNLIIEYTSGCSGCIFNSNSNYSCASSEEEINSIAKILTNKKETQCCGISNYIIAPKPPYIPTQPSVLIKTNEGATVGIYPVKTIEFNSKGGLNNIRINNSDIYNKFGTPIVTFKYTGDQLICKSNNLTAEFI